MSSYTFASLVGLVTVLAVISYVGYQHRSDGVKSLLFNLSWAAPFVVALSGVAFASGHGLFAASDVAFDLLVSLCVLFGCAAPLRMKIQAWQHGLSRKSETLLCLYRDLFIILALTVASFFLLEAPWNEGLGVMSLSMVFLGLGSILAILLTLYFVFFRTGWGLFLGVLVLGIAGIAEYFVLLFKGVVLMPSDLLALGTAAEVAGGYTLEFTDALTYALCGLVSALFVCSLVIRPSFNRNKLPLVSYGVNIAVSVGAGLLFFLGYSNIDYSSTFGCDKMCWSPNTIYQQQGFLPSFITLAQNLEISEPEGYSDEQAQEYEAEYVSAYDSTRGSTPERLQAVEQFDSVKPSVIAIMNESYSDLSAYAELGCGYQGPQYPTALTDALLTGHVTTSVYGGGTANSEFEFFTNTSMAYVGSAKCPYTLYDLSNVNNLVAQFSSLGYATTAIHPGNPSNYNRDKIYREFGFDAFYSASEFAESEFFHNAATDGATYSKVLDILSESEDPQFIFDLTMQNHGGYETGNIPKSYVQTYQPLNVQPSTTVQTNEYLACIKKSDEDLTWFLGQLRNLDRPVVVVFWGDHQPSFADQYNNLYYYGEDSAVHEARTHQTPYFIWANYDVAGNGQTSQQRDMGLNSLGATLLDIIGAPMTDFQKSTLGLREKIACMGLYGHRGYDGVWYLNDDEASPFIGVFEAGRFIQTLEFTDKL